MWKRLLATGAFGVAVGIACTWYALEEGDPDHGTTSVPAPAAAELPVDPAPVDEPHRVSLAEIASITDDFERNLAIYRLIENTDRERLGELFGEVGNLVGAPHRPDLVRVLYIRFAALDPDGAVDHVTTRAYRSSWLRAVFRAWAHVDLDAAVARAETLDGDAKLLATRTILDLELPDWQREAIATRLGGETILASIEADEDLRGQTDFSFAWQEALQVSDPRQRLQRLTEVIGAWALQDPAAAMAAAATVARQPSTGAFSPVLMLQGRVMQLWATSDPGAAIAWLAEQSPSTNLQTMTYILMGALVRKSLSDAILTLDALPEHLVGHAQQGLISAMHVPNAGIGEADFDTVLNWYSTLPPEDQAPLVSPLASAFVARNPERALDWAITLEGKAREEALRGIMVHLGMNDPEAAKRLVAGIEDEAVQLAAATSLIYTEAANDPRAALDWAQSFANESVRLELVRSVFGQWANADPEEAVRELLRLRDTQLRDDVASRVAFLLSRNDRIDLAEQLFDGIESPDARRSLARMLLRHFTRTDPNPQKAKRYEEIASPP